jgi:hypothetical protein
MQNLLTEGLKMISCTVEDISEADFIRVYKGCSTFDDGDVFLIEVIYGGIPHELCDPVVPLEFETYEDALKFVLSRLQTVITDFETIISFDNNSYSMQFHCNTTILNSSR